MSLKKLTFFEAGNYRVTEAGEHYDLEHRVEGKWQFMERSVSYYNLHKKAEALHRGEDGA